jgi:hypothetical protein
MTASKRVLKVAPYLPSRVEALGTSANQFAQADIGKCVKYSDDTMVLCTDGDDIAGIITSVEPYTDGGHSVGAVNMDVNAEAWATDEAGSLSVEDLVFCGTPAALGTAAPSTGPNVKVDASIAAANVHRWQVVAIYGTGTAGDGLLIRKL